ncbi:RHS repeat-associated core domain-containing protein, partial [Lysobacter sp. Root983]|uniref:RHS repeat-associated core domain-containing protein n=1 Tax=Lysobacter sp. Root983 TaxID=1736613 RepID=UPI000A48DA67
GTPRAVIDRTRNVAIWTWALQGEAFGNSPPNQDPDLDSTNFVFDMRFPGQRYDAATGLNYNYFRDYDAGSGRYVQSDPLGGIDGPATYPYAASRPIASIDPLGLLTVFVINHNGLGHVGYWTSRGGAHGQPSLYDPNGSFTEGGSSALIEGELANIEKFVAFQLKDGPKVTLYLIDTTIEEEMALTSSANDTGTWQFMDCASSSTSAARFSSDRFSGLAQAFTVGGASRSMESFMGAQSGKKNGLKIVKRGWGAKK